MTELKTIVALFDLEEQTGAVEDKMIVGHLKQLKSEGFKTCSNTLIRINKENLHGHKTDMYNQVIVMAQTEQAAGQESQSVYTKH